MRWVALLAVLANVLLAAWYVAIVRPAAQQAAQHQARETVVVQEGIPPVRLLSEMDEASRAAAGVVPLPAAKPAKAADAMPQCLLVGPIPERVTAVQLRERFLAVELDPDFRNFEVKLDPDYVVYLPPYATEAKTREALKKLRAAGIDSFYIADGELKGGISLGLYSQEASAQKVREQRAAQGYAAVVRPVTRSRSEIWAAFRETGSLGDEGYWRQLLADFPALSRRTVSCGAVASAEKLL